LLAVAPWALWAVVVLTLAAIVWSDHLLRQAGRPDLTQFDVSPAIAILAATTVGVVVAGRRPRHPVGWLMLAVVVCLGATGAAAQYLTWGLVRPGTLPGARVVALVYPATVYAALVALGFVLLLTPTGSLPSPRWRWWARSAVVVPVLLLVVVAVAPGTVDPYKQAVGSPFDFRGLGGVVLAANQVLLAVSNLGVLVAGGSLVVRFRHARGTERQQLRWMALPGVVTVLAALIVAAGLALGVSAVFSWVATIWILGVPLAIGAAVLRYRLYDLDRIISRTLAYGLLTVLLGGGYVAIVLGVSQLLGASSNFAVAGATLAVAAVFQPARRRIKAAVDRRFNRRRHDATRTIEAFATRLRQQVDLDALAAEILTVVDQTIQPVSGSLWLRPVPDPQPSTASRD
jgi:hypothetical protein